MCVTTLLPAPLHQVVGVLALDVAADPSTAPTACQVTSAGDLPAVRAALAGAKGTVVVIIDPGLPWRRIGRNRSGTHALCRKVEELGASLDRRVGPTYVLWPSATQPAFAIPSDARRAFAWLRRNGVLGGGRTAFARALVRQPAADRFMWWASPSAFVVLEP